MSDWTQFSKAPTQASSDDAQAWLDGERERRIALLRPDLSRPLLDGYCLKCGQVSPVRAGERECPKCEKE